MFMTAEGEIYGIAQKSGLAVETVRNLLEAGWVFVTSEEGHDTPPMWIAPEARVTTFIPHNEPWCEHVCANTNEHRHGFSCNKECRQCHGVCHPTCPAYKE